MVEAAISFNSKSSLKGPIARLIPGYGGDQPLIILGFGVRIGLRDYTRTDLEWLEVVANHFATLLFAYENREQHLPEVDQLLEVVTIRPPPDLVKHVQTGLKYVNDVIKLGSLPLAKELGVHGATQIERGRAVKTHLIEVLESLRPEGNRPREPIPTEWRKYVVLHDAYVLGTPHREIMAQLYISESSFYRERRDAIHGVASALFERRMTQP